MPFVCSSIVGAKVQEGQTKASLVPDSLDIQLKISSPR